ncbi:sensor domain-containing protein [Oceanisphaera ostreae]|uniref:Diguanylate cyclase domain-containing protein n=1 Tax=Oceanisphaera ostreae TaxID=914151 RepID=A0ABW3KEG2_9GAMM
MKVASALPLLPIVNVSQVALEQIENGVMLLDSEQKVLFWNQWLVRYSGVTAEAACGQRLDQLFNTPLPAVVMGAIKDACEQGLARLLSHHLHQELLPLHAHFISGDASPIFHSMVLRPLRHHGVVLVQLQNITTAVRREKHLRAKEKALRGAHQTQSEEKQFIDTVLDTMSALVVVTDAAGCIVNLNRSVELNTGFSQQQLQGQSFKMLLGLDGFKYLPSTNMQAAELSSFTCRMTNASGEPMHIRWTVKQVKEDGYPLRYLIYSGQDITERERADALLRLEREMLEMATGNASIDHIFNHICLALEQQLESCRVAVVQINTDHRLQVCNGPSLPESLCLRLQELQNARLLQVLQTGLELGQLQVFSVQAKGEHWQQWQQLAKQYKIAGCWLMPIQVNPQVSQRFLAVFPRYQSHPCDHEQMVVQRIGHLAALILDRQQQQQQIERLALYDSLTGLANRSLLNEQLLRCIHRSQRTFQSFALLFIDLDGFKAINDNYGHDAGDALLMELGLRLQNRFRATDCCARIGGDEFVILLDEIADDGSAFTLSYSLLELIAQPLAWGPHPLQVSASIGIALYPEDGDNAASLLTRADNAMYRAKAEGRSKADGCGAVIRLSE